MNWIPCNKTFSRELFEELGVMPEGKRNKYILFRCQEIKNGVPDGKTIPKLLSIEVLNEYVVSGRIDSNRYFEYFGRLYINDYIEVEID